MSRLRTEIKATLALALPLAAGFAGDQCLSLVDTIVAGRLGTTQIAAVGIASSLFFAGSVVAIGVLIGLDPLASQAIGAGRAHDARRHLREGIVTAALLAIPTMATIWMLQGVLEPVGVEVATRGAIRLYLMARLPSVLPLLMFVGLRSYLQANHLGRPALYATIVSNAINIPGDLIFALGDEGLLKLGLPALGIEGMGVMGIGAVSTVASFASTAVLFGVLRTVPVPEGTGKPNRAGMRALIAVGLPVGLHFLSEMGIFSAVSVLSGGFGSVIAGGHQVALQWASLTFTICLGLSNATAVRVGQAVGRGDRAGILRAGMIGQGAGVVFMAVTAVIYLTIPEALARLMSPEVAVIAAAVPLLQIAGVFQLFDGLQITAAGALRGAGDTRAGMVGNLFGHWVIGMPVGGYLAYRAEMGAAGLWWGLVAGLGVASVILSARFFWIAKRVKALK